MPCAWGLGGNSACFPLSLLLLFVSPFSPFPAGDFLSPSSAPGSRAWPVPSPSVPVGTSVLPGPCLRGLPYLFLSCFTFHFRIPCRADPSPERPSPPRAYRSVARISYISQATGGEERRAQGPLGKASGALSSCPPAPWLGAHSRLCWALASLCSYVALRVGYRAKPNRWRQNHSFSHLANIYLAPPVCQAPQRPWDPAVNRPGSHTRSRVGRRGGRGILGMRGGQACPQCEPVLGGRDADPALFDLIFLEKPETQLLFSYEFFDHLSIDNNSKLSK